MKALVCEELWRLWSGCHWGRSRFAFKSQRPTVKGRVFHLPVVVVPPERVRRSYHDRLALPLTCVCVCSLFYPQRRNSDLRDYHFKVIKTSILVLGANPLRAVEFIEFHPKCSAVMSCLYEHTSIYGHLKSVPTSSGGYCIDVKDVRRYRC